VEDWVLLTMPEPVAAGFKGSNLRHGFCLLALHVGLWRRGRAIVGAHPFRITVVVGVVVRSLAAHDYGVVAVAVSLLVLAVR
jgi:hypothetical protein